MTADERRAKIDEILLKPAQWQYDDYIEAKRQLCDWFLELIDNEIPEDDEYGYRKTLRQQLTAALGKEV
jgi:hypothetical protein